MSQDTQSSADYTFATGITYSRVVELDKRIRRPKISKPRVYKFKTIDIVLEKDEAEDASPTTHFKYAESM